MPTIYKTLQNLIFKLREDTPKKSEEKTVSASEPSKTFTPAKTGGESRKAREENSGGSTKRLVEEVLKISKKPNGKP